MCCYLLLHADTFLCNQRASQIRASSGEIWTDKKGRKNQFLTWSFSGETNKACHKWQCQHKTWGGSECWIWNCFFLSGNTSSWLKQLCKQFFSLLQYFGFDLFKSESFAPEGCFLLAIWAPGVCCLLYIFVSFIAVLRCGESFCGAFPS